MEAVIHRGRGLRCMTSSNICRILHILWKPNSIIILLIYHSFKTFPRVSPFRSPKNPTILSPGFLGQWFNNLQWAALLASLVQYDKDSFQMWSTEAGCGELWVWFWPFRNGEIFWMNNNFCYCTRRRQNEKIQTDMLLLKHTVQLQWKPALWSPC